MTLTLNTLSFERNYQYLFSNINCKINAGESLHVRGANGSGKSTLLRILAGFIETEKNKIQWQGQCITETRETYLQQIHYLGHQNGIKPFLSVLENLQLFLALTNHSVVDSKIKAAIEYVGLKEFIDTGTQTLSAGQLRRIALARLILHPTPLWILDEPTTALDTDGQKIFFHLLQEHLNQGGIAVLTAHHELPFQNSTQHEIWLDTPLERAI